MLLYNPTVSGSLLITGSLTTTGTLTAQTLVVQTITSSVDFVTGSSVNGSLSSDTHQFTGSVLMSGSLNVGSSSVSIPVNLFVSRNITGGTAAYGIVQNGIVQSDVTAGAFGFQNQLRTQAASFTISEYRHFTAQAFSIGSGSSVTTQTGFLAGATMTSAATNNYGFRGLILSGSGNYNLYIDGTAQNYIAGNVGIGTNSPAWLLEVYKDTTSGTTGGYPAISVNNPNASGYSGIYLYKGATQKGALEYNNAAERFDIGCVSDMAFITNAAFRMRINSAGNVGIGTTSPSVLLHVSGTMYATKIGGTNSTPAIQVRGPGGGPRIQTYGFDADSRAWMGLGTDMAGNPYEHSLYFSAPDNSPSAGMQTFGSYDGTTYSVKMTILRNGSIGAPTGTNIYNPSDVRLKQNITTITDGLNKIMGLNPVKFNWINNFVESENEKDMFGFIAQEVQTVIPEAIESFGGNSITIGDAVIDNPLRVNEKFIIPVLVKAIQELKAEIDTLKQQQ
jgi:hypothetical protein